MLLISFFNIEVYSENYKVSNNLQFRYSKNFQTVHCFLLSNKSIQQEIINELA